jgi:hypothetical protein
MFLNSGKSKFNPGNGPENVLLRGEAATKRPSFRKALDCLPKTINYFLALVSFFVVSADIFVVSADILLVVSGAIVVVSGVTVVLSLVFVLSALLLQAATDAAIIAIAKNFFIFEN